MNKIDGVSDGNILSFFRVLLLLLLETNQHGQECAFYTVVDADVDVDVLRL